MRHLSPTPTSSSDLTGTLLNGVWTGITSVVAHDPWIVPLVVVIVTASVVRGVRTAIHSGPRDPVRRFSRARQGAVAGTGG